MAYGTNKESHFFLRPAISYKPYAICSSFFERGMGDQRSDSSRWI
jgi:hypothetical protein